MRLSELLPDMDLAEAGALSVNGLALDSRELQAGNVFIALAGAKQHGLVHLPQALAKGAAAVVFEPSETGLALVDQVPPSVPMLAVENLGLKLGGIAARYYQYPANFLSVIGITGTNGKTSCSQFLSQVLENCGLIGTLGWGEWGSLAKTVNTTPDALETQRILASLLKSGKTVVAMEVSSHGLEQGRVNGIRFRGAVYTNISRDHLDYHGTMEAYFEAKLALLAKPGLQFVVVNLDDAHSPQIIARVPSGVTVWGVSLQGKTIAGGEVVNAGNVLHHPDGIGFDVYYRNQTQRIKVPLYGDFNAENSLTVLAVLLAMGLAFSEAVQKLALLKPVAGRMERFGGNGQPLVFVDYAHTPDALDKVLASVKKHCAKELWVVFGCGGNRDKGKRPQMGQIAQHWADRMVITDDNPRYEDGLAIINDILAGCSTQPTPGQAQPDIIQDRQQAIYKAIAHASADDCLVIAGKGHESYQESNGIQLPFSDSQVVMDALAMRANKQ